MIPDPSYQSGPDPRLKPSSSWLYWVGGLSLINMVMQLSGSNFQFSMGLGVTTILTALGDHLGPMAKTFSIGVTIVVALLLGLFGYMASKGAVWAFIAGITVLLLDTLLLFIDVSGMLISILFHVWAIVSLCMGLKLAVELQRSRPA